MNTLRPIAVDVTFDEARAEALASAERLLEGAEGAAALTSEQRDMARGLLATGFLRGAGWMKEELALRMQQCVKDLLLTLASHEAQHGGRPN